MDTKKYSQLFSIGKINWVHNQNLKTGSISKTSWPRPAPEAKLKPVLVPVM
jgi:hypothetical protein